MRRSSEASEPEAAMCAGSCGRRSEIEATGAQPMSSCAASSVKAIFRQRKRNEAQGGKSRLRAPSKSPVLKIVALRASGSMSSARCRRLGGRCSPFLFSRGRTPRTASLPGIVSFRLTVHAGHPGSDLFPGSRIIFTAGLMLRRNGRRNRFRAERFFAADSFNEVEERRDEEHRHETRGQHAADHDESHHLA